MFFEVCITNNKPTIFVGATQNLCIDNTVLTGNPLDIGDEGIWTSITPGSHIIVNPTQYDSQVTGLESGTTIFQWTVSNEYCEVSEQLIVNYTCIVADAGEDQAVCADSVQLSANLPAGATGEWFSLVPGPQIVNPTIINTWVTNLNQDSNLFIWNVYKNGSEDSDYVIIDNNQVFANVGEDQEICTDQTTLSANDPSLQNATGIWHIISGFGYITNQTSYNTEVANLMRGVNTFRWTVTNGECSDSDQLQITNRETSAFVDLDFTTCISTTNLNASNPEYGIGLWTKILGEGIILTPTIYNSLVELSEGDNTFVWTVTEGECSDSDTVIITYITATANAGNDQTICTDYTTLSANDPSLQNATGEWMLISGGGFLVNPSSYNAEITNLEYNENIFVWYVQNNYCTASDTVIITNNQVIANAGADITVCSSTESYPLIGNDPGDGTGLWEIISGSLDIADATSYDTDVTNVSNGVNNLRWTVSENGCSDEDYVLVINNSFTVTAGNDRTVCVDSVILPVSENGTWEIIEGGISITTNSENNTALVFLTQGDNTLRWTVTKNGCSDSDTIIITNNEVFAIAAPDHVVCVNYSTLNAANPVYGIGEWSLLGGAGIIETPSINSSQVSELAEGDNTFRWTVTNGECVEFDDLIVTYNQGTTANAGLDDTTNIDSYQLQAIVIPEETGTWSLLGGSGIFDDYSNPNTDVNDLAYGNNTFRWNSTYNECDNFDDVVILRTVNAGGDIIMEGDTVYLNAILPEGAIGEWTIMHGTATIEGINNPNTRAWDLAMGQNTFRWTVTFPDKGLVLWDEVNVDRILGIENIDTKIIIYPNPSTGIFNIITEESFGESEILIYNIAGSLVAFETLEKSSNKLTIKLKENKSGVYFIKIKMQNAVIIEKIIIQ